MAPAEDGGKIKKRKYTGYPAEEKQMEAFVDARRKNKNAHGLFWKKREL